MAWFKKKDKVIDLGKKYKEQQAAQREAKKFQENRAQTQTSQTSARTNSTSSTGNTGGFGIFDSGTQTSQTNTQTSTDSDFVDIADTMEGRRKRLAKRIMEMTSKMENLSNQVYHLQQRIEVLERKLSVGSY